MKRRRISAYVKLYFLMMAIFLVIGCGGGGGGGGAAAPSASTYSISGSVSGDVLSGVTINLTGTATKSTTTAADGSYSFSGLQNGSYTITPSAAGYTFSPTTLTSVTVSGANLTGQNFVATAVPTYTISGAVSGAILAGVTISVTGTAAKSTTTGVDGSYSISGLQNGTYTITPSLAGYKFSPTSLTSVNVSGADVTGQNFVATDNSLTWKEFMLATSSSSTASWRRRTLRFDATTGGLIAASSCLNSSSSTTCPTAGSITWTNSSGVISESGSSADSTVHMTITSTGNFIAGTGGSSSSPHLRVAMKVVPGTVYTNADVQGQSFVFHEMVVGSSTMWRYGRGATDGAGAITLSSKTDISGTTATPDTTWGTLAVDASGVVTISGISTFSGFLADDKKTVVGVYTSGTTYRLMILQITARNDYPAGPLPASTWKSSFLAKSNYISMLGSAQAGWIYCTNTVDGSGNMSFGTDWTSSNSQFSSNRPTTAFTGAITSSGEVTMTDSSYNGQASDDWNFLVGTMTLVTDVAIVGTVTIYLLQISTR